MSIENTDKGFAGFEWTSQLGNIQTQGPMPYTTYDLLKHWSWIISIIKFLAHIFSLPLMVVLRRDFGMRYVDAIHIGLSFIIWHIAGMFAFGDTFLSQMASPVIAVAAWVFLPAAYFHRFRAKKAALRKQQYSYYPGMPRLAPVVLFLAGRLFRLFGGLLGKLLGPVPRILTHPDEVLTPEIIQGIVRRFIDPFVVATIGVLCILFGITPGFGLFLGWTALLLHLDETISQRTQWEMYLDAVDAQVIAQEKQRLLSGDTAGAGKTGFSLASVANLKQLANGPSA